MERFICFQHQFPETTSHRPQVTAHQTLVEVVVAAAALAVAPPRPATEHLPREVDSAVALVAALHRPPTERPLSVEISVDLLVVALVDLSVVVLLPPLTELHPSVETHPRHPTEHHRLEDLREDLSEVVRPLTLTDLLRPATVLPLLVDPSEVAAVSR